MTLQPVTLTWTVLAVAPRQMQLQTRLVVMVPHQLRPVNPCRAPSLGLQWVRRLALALALGLGLGLALALGQSVLRMDLWLGKSLTLAARVRWPRSFALYCSWTK